MEHEVASRFEYKEDKCPVCKFTNQNFIKVSECEFCCYRCGAMFLNKRTREEMRSVQRRMLKEQGKDKRLVCECGFEAKSKAGLQAHKRACG